MPVVDARDVVQVGMLDEGEAVSKAFVRSGEPWRQGWTLTLTTLVC
jgi:hypothetical protein